MPAASFDTTRRSMVLSRDLIPAALMLHAGTGTTPQAIDQLEAATVVLDGRLHPVARSMLTTMTDPETVATVELTSRDEAPSLTTVWTRADFGVIGASQRENMFALHLVERTLLPFHVAQVLRIGRRPTPGVVLPIEVPTWLVAASRPHWTSENDMQGMLATCGVETAAAGALALAHSARIATWRVTVLLLDEGGTPDHTEVVVLDGDAGGYWRLGFDREAAGTIEFVPLYWSDTLTLLGRLFPPR